MQSSFGHMFPIQLFMLFHMAASVLLFFDHFLLVKILQQPIRIHKISSFWSCHGEENACYHVKELKKLGQKLVSKVTLHNAFSLGPFIEKTNSEIAFHSCRNHCFV